MNKNECDQAFPRSGNQWANDGGSEGMTLRDWFAGQALVGLLAAGAEKHGVDAGFSEVAYKHADLMLTERGKS